METVLEATVELTVEDGRCDRCGARAQVCVELDSGLELLFCGHHISKYEDGLEAVAKEVLAPHFHKTPPESRKVRLESDSLFDRLREEACSLQRVLTLHDSSPSDRR